MIAESPYVVLVTGPSAGVGKSTLSTNLAVYLKALDEELPVAYASLDVDANVDAMFQLGARPQFSLVCLLDGFQFSDLFTLGQYGVEYCSGPDAAQLDTPMDGLRKALLSSNFPGVLLLDVAGDSCFLSAALAVADLVFVPVKDPAALPEIVGIQKQLLAAGGSQQQLWLLPSQLGAESSYHQQVELEGFLRFAAEERDFQVLSAQFCCDTQVAEQAVQQAKSVLTRVPQSDLHQQLRKIAELVLQQRQQQNSFLVRVQRMLQDGLLPPRLKRLALICPLCKEPVLSDYAHYLEALPSRKRLLLHQNCVALLLKETAAEAFLGNPGLTLVQSDAVFGGRSELLRLQLLTEDAMPLHTETVDTRDYPAWIELVKVATGRCLPEIYREGLLYSEAIAIDEIFTDIWYAQFVTRRRALWQACREERL